MDFSFFSNISTGSRQAVACGKFRQHVKWFRNMLQPHQDKCAYFSCKNKAALSKKQALYTRKSELWKTDLVGLQSMHACCATASKSGAQTSCKILPTVAQALRAQARQRSKSQRSHGSRSSRPCPWLQNKPRAVLEDEAARGKDGAVWFNCSSFTLVQDRRRAFLEAGLI